MVATAEGFSVREGLDTQAEWREFFDTPGKAPEWDVQQLSNTLQGHQLTDCSISVTHMGRDWAARFNGIWR